MIRVFGVAALAAAWVGCGPSGTLSGKVEVAGGDAARATVTLTGEVTRAAAVAEDGTFAFKDLPDGVYLVEASVPSTLEGQLSARGQVGEGGGAMEPLVFTGTGAVTGRVLAPGSVLGAEVFIAGTPVRQRVAEDGSFQLERVPAGAQTLVAVRDGYEPASLPITVAYAQTLEDQTLSLAEPAHGSGILSGRAYYFDRDVHSGITVTVEGTTLSAQTDAQGEYTLVGVPAGDVTLVATANGYAAARQVNVVSLAAGSPRPPDLRLSYQLQRFAGVVSAMKTNAAGTRALFVGTSEYDDAPALWFVDFTSDAPARIVGRLGAVATSLEVWWKDDETRAAVRFGSSPSLMLANLESGGLTEVTGRLSSELDVRFAANRLFFLESGAARPVLAVYDLTQGGTTRLEEVDAPIYCPESWGLELYRLSREGRAAWLQAAPNNETIVRVWDGTAVSTHLSGERVTCLTWAGDGTQLLGMRLTSPRRLWNLTAAAPVILYEVPTDWYLSWSPFSLSGDLTHALAVEATGTLPTQTRVVSIPVAGGGTHVLATFAGSIQYVSPQREGDLVAFSWPSHVEVRSLDGTFSRTWTGPAETNSAWVRFSPSGKRVLWQFGAQNLVHVADATTWDERTQPAALNGGNDLSQIFFSPNEALSWYLVGNAASYQMTFFRMEDGTALDLPFVGLTAPSMVWSEHDHYVLMRAPSDDRLVDAETGAVTALGRSAFGFPAGQSATFTGSEAQLVFAQTNDGSGRVLRASTTSGELRAVADNEPGLGVGPVKGMGRVWLLDVSGVGEARGLYTVEVP